MSQEAIDDTAVNEEVEEVAVDADAEATTTEDTEVNDEATQEDETLESSTESESKKKGKDGVQKRIDELTADIYDLRRDRDYWRNMNSKPAESKPPEVQLKTLADFDYDETAYTKHVQESIAAQTKAEYEQQATRQSQAQKEANFRSSEAKFASEKSDYYAVTNDPRLEISDGLAEAVMDSDIGPDLAYHLAKNQSVASKLSRMPYKQMLREVVKIEANLSKPAPKSESKTPPPPPKIAGNDKASTVRADTKDSDSLSTEEWMKRRNKQLSK